MTLLTTPAAVAPTDHRIRWWILLLLFFAMEINILDRQVPSLVAPVLRDVPVPLKPEKAPPATTPQEAADFLARAPVDMLAVANGTTHGVFQSQTDLDYAAIRALRARVDVPLVQHGTGGISLADLARLKDAGMSKVNFGEGFRYDYVRHFSDLTRIGRVYHVRLR